MQAKHMMTRHPAFVLPGDSVARAAELLRDLRIGSVPVVADAESQRIVGILTDRDLAVRCVARAHDGHCTVTEHMTPVPLATVTEMASATAVVDRMAEASVRRILVTNEDGTRLVGIIAQADVARLLGPTEPIKVEYLLETLSKPSRAAAPSRQPQPASPAFH